MANPHLVQYLQELHAEIVGTKAANSYAKVCFITFIFTIMIEGFLLFSEHQLQAIKSLKLYPLPIRSGKDAMILEGVGKSIAEKLDAYFTKTNGPSNNKNNTTNINNFFNNGNFNNKNTAYNNNTNPTNDANTTAAIPHAKPTNNELMNHKTSNNELHRALRDITNTLIPPSIPSNKPTDTKPSTSANAFKKNIEFITIDDEDDSNQPSSAMDTEVKHPAALPKQLFIPPSSISW